MRSALLLAALAASTSSAHAASCTVDVVVDAADACRLSRVGTAGATGARDAWCGTSGLDGGEVVVALTPPAGLPVRVLAGPALAAHGAAAPAADVDLFVTEDDCAPASSCATASTGPTSTSEAVFVADGSTYFVALDADAALGGWGWGLEVSCGRLCDPASIDGEVTCSSDVPGTTVAGTDDLSWYACGTPTAGLRQTGAESILAFTPEVSGPVTVRLSGLTSDHDVYVMQDTCTAAACVASSTATSIGADAVTFDAVAGRVAYVVVEAYGGPGTWTLSFDAGQGGCPEDCDDGVDDDHDALVDCDDPDCGAEPVCDSCDRDGDGFAATRCGGGDCADRRVDVGDADRDGAPDACDVCAGGVDALDADRDGVPDACDACPRFDDGADADADGVADGCDACPDADDADDADADTVPDGCDACDGEDDRLDADADHAPDACDACPGEDDRLDGDGDGVPNACDSCDAATTDGDADGVPDACDACPAGDDHLDADADLVPDACDVCPAGDDARDGDRDGAPDACDACPGDDDARDLDHDGIPDACDACPGADDRVDADADGTADACDACPGHDDAADVDHDGAADACDACPGEDDALDFDHDGTPNGCDACLGADDRLDADHDRVPDACDVCPAGDDRADHDADGLADACDVCPTVAVEVDDDGDGDPACAECDDHDPRRDLRDRDHDGFASCAGDCADADPAVRPGAVEDPDGVDQDCDGVVDDGTAWSDDDGDGASELGGDCDDADPDVRSGAPEACDGVDQDCDGAVDDGTPCADDDGDGWCEAGCTDGSLPGDCRDDAAAVSPDATELDGNGADDDCDGAIDASLPDLDADGFAVSGGDCDDHDASVHPGAAELPDGVDDDCDGDVDEGTGLADDDADGVSDGAGDCDDADPGVHPGADEVVNGLDDDCDGDVDEGTSAADDDHDGVSEVGGDCDDADPQVRPGLPERADGVDDDCDGQIDEGLADADGDGFTADQGDCDDGDGWVHPESHEVCDGADDDCDGQIDEDCLAEVVDSDLPPPTEPDRACGGCASTGPGPGLLVLVVLPWLRRRRALAAAALAGCASGEGPLVVDIVPDVELAPGFVDLGAVVIGRSTPVTLTFDVTRGKAATITAVELTPVLGEGFAYEGPATAEVDADTVLSLPLEFVGATPGYVEAELSVTSDARGSPHRVLLRARALDAEAWLQPSSIDLGVVPAGTQGHGTTTLSVGSVGFTLTSLTTVAETLFVTLGASPELAAHEDRPVQVTYVAHDDAPFEATVRFAAGDRELPLTLVVRANDCEEGLPAAYDVDQDGVSSCAGDCDDHDAAISPRVPDVEDGVDQDCDGRIDEGTPSADDDGDGWCDGAACLDGSRPGDCRDDDATVRPGAPEIPENGVDDDCDGTIDAGVPDLDRDGVSAGAGDCDDQDPSRRPGAPEVEDGVDQDCDLLVDEGTSAADDDHDGWCEATTCVDGAQPGDCDDAARETHPGAPELRNHRDDDCDHLVDEGTDWADDDGDGFTERGGDCDDADPTRSPVAGC